jgi:kynurenine formamidase
VAAGHPVHGWELADAAAACGVEPRAGDAVVIRSGHGAYFAAHAGEQPGFASPSGVHASCIEFLYETDASLLVWDWQDAPLDQQGLPNPLPIDHPLHVHNVVLPYLGMPILDNADLEDLAAACERLQRFEFQLVVAPLVIEGATGSPVNPIAVM